VKAFFPFVAEHAAASATAPNIGAVMRRVLRNMFLNPEAVAESIRHKRQEQRREPIIPRHRDDRDVGDPSKSRP
jgi:hypothetical protein